MARTATKKTSSGFSLENAPGHLLRRAQQYAYDLYMAEVGRDGLTPRQFTVLFAVSEDEGLSQTDLVNKTGIDRSTLADMISRLLSKGLLQRERTKTDARANSVSITAAGRRALTSALPKVKKAEDRILQGVAVKNRAALIAALSDIAAKMDAEAAPKKPAARKTAAKKTPVRKTAAKKAPARKTAAKKAPARKTAATKATTTRRKAAAKPKAAPKPKAKAAKRTTKRTAKKK